MYFKVLLNTPIASIEHDEITQNAVVHLNKTEDAVLMKVGISYTSKENAALNLEKEIPHWSFEQVVKESKRSGTRCCQEFK
ncbi:hypothetical protein Q2T40_03745 [Winogradskyella maritima]|nr:hypothetical protein [Winogradskyella maritima]